MPAPSFPTPASLKKTLESGTSSANSPELTPPCEADTTCAPASSGMTFVIESMITTRPFPVFKTVVFNMVGDPFVRGEQAGAVGQAAFGGLQISLTDCSTAWGSNTRCSQSLRKMTGFACAIACSAPSENRPSG